MPPEREPASTRPPSRRNWSSSAAETNSGPSSDGVPPTQQKLPLTVPKDASAVVAKSPPVVRKEPTSQATIKPAAKASAKAKPARLNASAASRIMKGKSAAEAIGATIPDFSATPQPRPRAGDDEAAPSRITHPTLDEDGEDDAVKLAKQRRRLAEGESMVAYIDDMGVDWKLVSKRFEKDPARPTSPLCSHARSGPTDRISTSFPSASCLATNPCSNPWAGRGPGGAHVHDLGGR